MKKIAVFFGLMFIVLSSCNKAETEFPANRTGLRVQWINHLDYVVYIDIEGDQGSFSMLPNSQIYTKLKTTAGTYLMNHKVTIYVTDLKDNYRVPSYYTDTITGLLVGPVNYVEKGMLH